MTVINPLSEITLTKLDDTTIYEGEVVANDDPLKLCRVKVSIPELFGDLTTENIPWAVQRRGIDLGSSDKTSLFIVPRVGTKVNVRFAAGDIYSPVYESEDVKSNSVPEIFKENYPTRYGRIDEKGNYWLFDLTDDEYRIFVNGEMFLTVKENKLDDIKQSWTVKVGEDLKVTVRGDAARSVGISDSEIIGANKNSIVGNDVNEVVHHDKNSMIKNNHSLTIEGDTKIATKNFRVASLESTRLTAIDPTTVGGTPIFTKVQLTPTAVVIEGDTTVDGNLIINGTLKTSSHVRINGALSVYGGAVFYNQDVFVDSRFWARSGDWFQDRNWRGSDSSRPGDPTGIS